MSASDSKPTSPESGPVGEWWDLVDGECRVVSSPPKPRFSAADAWKLDPGQYPERLIFPRELTISIDSNWWLAVWDDLKRAHDGIALNGFWKTYWTDKHKKQRLLAIMGTANVNRLQAMDIYSRVRFDKALEAMIPPEKRRGVDPKDLAEDLAEYLRKTRPFDRDEEDKKLGQWLRRTIEQDDHKELKRLVAVVKGGRSTQEFKEDKVKTRRLRILTALADFLGNCKRLPSRAELLDGVADSGDPNTHHDLEFLGLVDLPACQA